MNPISFKTEFPCSFATQEYDTKGDLIFSFLLSFILFVMVSLICFITFFGLCTIKMDSMNDTFYSGDHVLVYKYPLNLDYGNVVIVKENKDPAVRPVHEPFIKRLIAKEGDTLRFEKDQRIFFNQYSVKLLLKKRGETEFSVVQEPYLKDGKMTYLEGEPTDPFYHIIDQNLVVPQDCYYLLGDNRDYSLDSRKLGFFNRSEIMGKYCLHLKDHPILEGFLLFLYGNAEES